jgi:hypothetical protein
MERIAEAFRQDFANWGFEIPSADLQSRRASFIHAQRWLNQYVFGRNRFGDFLHYYGTHRMTSDEHVRLYANGRRQHLAAIAPWCLTSKDPRKAARLEAAYYRKNRRIARSLVAKGFNKFTMNMSLRAGLEG